MEVELSAAAVAGALEVEEMNGKGDRDRIGDRERYGKNYEDVRWERESERDGEGAEAEGSVSEECV